MGKKATAFVLAALLTLGLTGCGSGGNNNTANDGTRNTYDNRDDYLNDFGRSRSLGDDLNDAADDVEDTLTGDSRRYQEMLENGRVHDSDGFLLDGENRHD